MMLGPKGQLLLVGTPIPHRTRCLCESRHMGVHQAAIAGSRYAEFAGYGRRYDDRLAANAGYVHDLASGILIGGQNNWHFEVEGGIR
jgi:hypothetical protein